ncbi:hypothetical protein [Acinetobacter courvalinii]|uniref:hypothetical protein n=1 Tax=Acinetobacter courvalinii TaxID=280147 RepID=UPI0021D1DCB5|nr:hypothetical protein [Acinetobacter courvalinii]MCU4638507.1 hypothetical protein [Acinetobacter courvalinii]
MPQYLRIAETVYRQVKENKDFQQDPLENLNNLMIEIRKELKGSKLKLLYNFIDFEECLNRPNAECKVKLDVSLIPAIKNEGEFILWLAGFIQRITTDGKRKLPPIRKEIPPEFKYTLPKAPQKTAPVQAAYSKSGELINSYFKSDEFMEAFNKSH